MIFKVVLETSGVWYISLKEIKDGMIQRYESYCESDDSYYNNACGSTFASIEHVVSMEYVPDRRSVRPVTTLGNLVQGDKFKLTSDGKVYTKLSGSCSYIDDKFNYFTSSCVTQVIKVK